MPIKKLRAITGLAMTLAVSLTVNACGSSATEDLGGERPAEPPVHGDSGIVSADRSAGTESQPNAARPKGTASSVSAAGRHVGTDIITKYPGSYVFK